MSTSATTPAATTSTAAPGHRPAAATSRRTSLVVGAAVLAISATLSITNHNSLGELVVDVAVEVVASALVFLVVVPRGLLRATAGPAAVVLGVLAVLLAAPAFWSGLPLIFGAAAALLGNAGRRAGGRAAPALVALVCGLLGVIGYFAIYVADAASHF